MDNQNCNIPDCVKELSLLKSLIYTLELKLKNLGLENLKDVAYCLNPKIGDTLIYNGSTWVAEKGSGGGGSNVSVESLLPTGNLIAKITVDGEEHTINESNISVNPLINEGTPIAEITTENGTKHIIKLAPGGEGNLDNIKVNNITGTVNNKIAEVTVTGNDVEVSTFAEPDKTNEELEIESSDKVTEALAKLLKALKDDEVVVAKAFHAVKEATGFDTNLHYVVEVDDPILGLAEDLLSADRLLKDHLSNLKTHVSNVTDKLGIQFTGGITGSFVMTDLNAYGNGYVHNITVPLFTVINVTVNYPIKEYLGDLYDYYTDALVRNLVYQPKSIVQIKGGLYTWEVSSGVWELWQYVGTDTLEVNWINSNNWIKRW